LSSRTKQEAEVWHYWRWQYGSWRATLRLCNGATALLLPLLLSSVLPHIRAICQAHCQTVTASLTHWRSLIFTIFLFSPAFDCNSHLTAYFPVPQTTFAETNKVHSFIISLDLIPSRCLTFLSEIRESRRCLSLRSSCQRGIHKRFDSLPNHHANRLIRATSNNKKARVALRSSLVFFYTTVKHQRTPPWTTRGQVKGFEDIYCAEEAFLDPKYTSRLVLLLHLGHCRDR
jgi:hypothetical protein